MFPSGYTWWGFLKQGLSVTLACQLLDLLKSKFYYEIMSDFKSQVPLHPPPPFNYVSIADFRCYSEVGARVA